MSGMPANNVDGQERFSFTCGSLETEDEQEFLHPNLR